MIALAWVVLAVVAIATLALMGQLLKGVDSLGVGMLRAVVGLVIAFLAAGALVLVALAVAWAADVIW